MGHFMWTVHLGDFAWIDVNYSCLNIEHEHEHVHWTLNIQHSSQLYVLHC